MSPSLGIFPSAHGFPLEKKGHILAVLRKVSTWGPTAAAPPATPWWAAAISIGASHAPRVNRCRPGHGVTPKLASGSWGIFGRWAILYMIIVIWRFPENGGYPQKIDGFLLEKKAIEMDDWGVASL